MWLLLSGLVLPHHVRAQTAADSTTYPPRGEYRHDLTILAPYDPTYDKTVLQTEPFSVDPSTSISFLTALDGRQVVNPPPSIVVMFWSTAPVGTYAVSPNARATLANGQVLDLGTASLGTTPRAPYHEVLLKSLSVGQFLMLANAPVATLHLGPTAFALSPSQIRGLRDFASRMAPISH